MAPLDEALHLTGTCRPSTIWRPPSRCLGALGHTITAVDVPILLASSPHILLKVATSKPACNPPRQALAPSRVDPKWACYLLRDAVAHQVVATTAATGQGTTVVITGIDAAATAAVVIVVTTAVRMTTPTPHCS